jgi:hypothetical protein
MRPCFGGATVLLSAELSNSIVLPPELQVSNPFPCRSSESLSLERAQGGSDCRAGQSGQYLGYQEHATRHTGRRPCNRTANSDPQGQRQERDRGGLADLPVLQSSSSSTCRPPARSGSKFRRRCSRADEVIE